MISTFQGESLALICQAVTVQLWDSGAVSVNLEKPYQLVSGNFSPIYVNCRRLISVPTFVDLFCTSFAALCRHSQVAFDVIAGGETAGIPFAAFAARHVNRPMMYVRKAAKEHGLQSQVEGHAPAGSQVLLVEDLITDAGSKLIFVDALRRSGYVIEDIVVIFDRGQGGSETLATHGVRLHALANMSSALSVAETLRLLSPEETSIVRLYLRSPAEWHAQQGLPFRQSQ